jgi:hypothetical protein
VTEDKQEHAGAKVDKRLVDAAALLLVEIDVILSSNRWAIISNGSADTRHRLYDAAALRHVAALLRDLALCAQADQELAVRILGRTHVEAWLTAVYLHFGGPEALQRIAEDTRYETTLTDEAIKRHDDELGQAKRKARKRLKAVRKANDGISLWNSQYPEETRKPFHTEPYVPQQPKTGVDLSSRLVDFEDFKERTLTVGDITEALTKLGCEKGFAYESFTQVYLYYRLTSSSSVHPNLHIYDSYFYRETPHGEFLHTAVEPIANSAITGTITTALYGTALLAKWVLGDAGHDTPVADLIRAVLEPDPDAGWTPGVDSRSADKPWLAPQPRDEPDSVPSPVPSFR